MSAERLFRIINILLEQKIISATTLAKQLEVSTRTIYRDIDKLTLANVPVYTQQGRDGGISLLPNYILNKTLLSDQEQEQIIMGLKNVSSVYQEANDLTMKLQALFQNDSMDWLEVDLTNWGDSDKDIVLFAVLKEAILKQKSITFDYLGSNQTRTTREVLPAKLVYKSKAWYLQGYCLIRKEYRIFKLSRMKNTLTTTYIFPDKLIPPSMQPMDSIKNQEVVLEFDKQISYRVFEEFDDQNILIKEDCLLVTCNMPIDTWLQGYILSFGSSCKVIKPSELQKYFQKEINRLNKIYNT